MIFDIWRTTPVLQYERSWKMIPIQIPTDNHRFADFWNHIQEKAKANIGRASGDEGPHDEEQVKCHMVHALRHTDWKTNAEVFVESIEWMTAYLMLKYMHSIETNPQKPVIAHG